MLVPDESKTVFVICPIGSEGGDVRRQSDQLMKFIIKPVAEELGFTVERADLIVESGLITAQIFSRLATAPLVLADLSGHNPNVFYELAVRHAVRKPVIHLIAKGQTIPFDVSNNRALFYELELEAVEKAKADLHSMVLAAMTEEGPVESPISEALARVQLATSDEPVERRDAELLSMVSDIRTRLTIMEGRRRKAESTLTLAEFQQALTDFVVFADNCLMEYGQREQVIQLVEAFLTIIDDLYKEGDINGSEISELRHPSRFAHLRSLLEKFVSERDSR